MFCPEGYYLGGIIFLFFGILIWYIFSPSRCYNCGITFNWNDLSVTTHPNIEIGSFGTVYNRNGNQVTFCSKWYKIYRYTCSCKHVNERSYWFDEKYLQKIEEPFLVKDCKMCKGKGSLKFDTDDDLRLVGGKLKYVSGGSGKMSCGLCNGYGWKKVKD